MSFMVQSLDDPALSTEALHESWGMTVVVRSCVIPFHGQ